MLTDPSFENRVFSNPSTSPLHELPQLRHYIDNTQRNHVGNGYVLGSSAHIEVCLTVPCTPSVLILIQSRTLALSAFVLSIGVYTGMLPGYYVIWHTPYIWQFPPQLWRLVTSFLMTGPDLGILFDTYFRRSTGSAAHQHQADIYISLHIREQA